jgi:hypothetical protein
VNSTAGPSTQVDSINKPPSLKAPTKVDNSAGNVKVFCRFRPLNKRELATTESETCVIFKDEFTCAVSGINKDTGRTEPIDYTFDATFDMDSR